MEKLRIIILIVGCVSILFGYLRFITDDKGNVNLNSYRFTGGLGYVILGMFEGTRDLVSCNISKNGLSAISIYLGTILFYISFSVLKI